MSGKKFGRYRAYASGEVFLLVVGILIALQINHWNEDRKDKALEPSCSRVIRYLLLYLAIKLRDRL